MARVMQGLHDRLAHHAGAAEDAIETRVGAHFEDGRHTAPFLTEQLRPGIVEFDFGGRVGAVAELVLQSLDEDAVAACRPADGAA